jgi:hypothetical protein
MTIAVQRFLFIFGQISFHYTGTEHPYDIFFRLLCIKSYPIPVIALHFSLDATRSDKQSLFRRDNGGRSHPPQGTSGVGLWATTPDAHSSQNNFPTGNSLHSDVYHYVSRFPSIVWRPNLTGPNDYFGYVHLNKEIFLLGFFSHIKCINPLHLLNFVTIRYTSYATEPSERGVIEITNPRTS